MSMPTDEASQAASKRKYLVELLDEKKAVIAVKQIEESNETMARVKAVIAFSMAGIIQTSQHSYNIREVPAFRLKDKQLTLFGFEQPEETKTAPCALRTTISTAECQDCEDKLCPFSPVFDSSPRRDRIAPAAAL